MARLYRTMESKGLSKYAITLTDKNWEPWFAQTKSNAMLYPEVSATIRTNKEPDGVPKPYSLTIMTMAGEQARSKRGMPMVNLRRMHVATT